MGVPVFFIFLAILAAVCFPLVLTEDNQVRLFSVRWYRKGIIVYRNALIIPTTKAELLTKEVYTKEEGVNHFADDGNIYFRSVASQSIWKLRTPLPFKCTGILISADAIEITARLPLAASILFFSLMAIGLLLTLAVISTGYYFLVISLSIFLLSYFTERSRLHTLLSELKTLLEKGH